MQLPLDARDRIISCECLGADMCDSYIKSHNITLTHFKIEIPEGKFVSMSNAEHIEHSFCPKTCLSLVLRHIYKINSVWMLVYYK